MGRYFGSDGIRGKYGDEINAQLMKKVGRALGIFKTNICIVAMDTRNSSKELKDALISGLNEAGFTIYDINISSSPSLIYLTKYYKCLGAIVTASHLPSEYNGLKIAFNGRKLTEEEMESLENELGKTIPVSDNRKLQFFSNYEYTKALSNFRIREDLKVAFDFANGALSYQYKEVLKNYKFRTALVGNKPDGKNINLNSGINDLSLLKQAIDLESCDYGFAFDGDADSLIMVDKDFNIFDSEKILYILANYYKSKGKLTGDMVVVSPDHNPGLKNSLLKELEVNVSYSLDGDRCLVEAMQENNAILGGDIFNHIVLRKISNASDGLLVALFLLEIFSDRKPQDLLDGYVEEEVLCEKYRDYDDRFVQSQKYKKELEHLISTLVYPDDKMVIVARKTDYDNLFRITIKTVDKALDKKILKEIEELAGATK